MKTALVALGFAIALVPAAVSAQERVQTGILHCKVAPGVSYIVGSSKAMDCVYRPAQGKIATRYAGQINRVGPDIGFTNGGFLDWAVFGPSNHKVGALVGTYVGASASATVGVGLSGNLLVGGSNNTIALQPLSVGSQTGLDAALAVSSLTLNGGAGKAMKKKKRG